MAGRDAHKALASVGLLALSVVTLVTSALALLQHREAPAAEPAASPAPAPASPSDSPTGPGLATAATTPTAPPASPTSTASVASPVPEPLAAFSAALAGDGASVLVLGDGSGNDADEWVSVWAEQHLSSDRMVSYVSWNREAQAFDEPKQFGVSGPAITVWNASVRSPTLSNEPARLGKAWNDQDAVLLSYGHRKHPADIRPSMDAILAAVRELSATVPVAVILQNPDPSESADQQERTVSEIADWATAESLPVINVYDGFPSDQSERDALVESDGSPTPDGSALFAEIVAGALASAS